MLNDFCILAEKCPSFSGSGLPDVSARREGGREDTPKMGRGGSPQMAKQYINILRMGLPIVENLSGLNGNIFNISRIPQLHFH